MINHFLVERWMSIGHRYNMMIGGNGGGGGLGKAGPVCPSRILHGLSWGWSGASMVESRTHLNGCTNRKENHRLREFWENALDDIWVLVREELTGQQRTLRSGGIRSLYSSQNIAWWIKSRRMRSSSSKHFCRKPLGKVIWKRLGNLSVQLLIWYYMDRVSFCNTYVIQQDTQYLMINFIHNIR
jgi:hypothetical protein